MSKPSNPTEIARETLKQLAVRRIVPTPDHYEAIYHQIAQTPEEERLHPGLKQIVESLAALPQQTPELQRKLGELRKTASAEDWPAFPKLLFSCLEGQGAQAELTRNWSDLIRDLIRQWDLRNPVFTPSRKKDALEKVLINFGSDSGALNEKLAGLVRSWSETGTEGSGGAAAETSREQAYEADAIVPAAGTGWADWRNALVQALQLGVEARLAHNPDLQEEAASLANEAARIEHEAGLQALTPRLRKFWLKLELQNDQEMRLCDGLLSLLRLLTDNMAEVVIDDEWVQGQIAVVQKIMSQPLDMSLIYSVEAGLKEVLFKQGQLKHNLKEAQTVLKDMIATFIDRLGSLSDSTDNYHSKITVYAEKIQKANDLPSISHVMEDLLQDTRSMQLDVQRSRDEMREAQRKADEAQQKIRDLEKELQAVSEKVRVDQLTGALNRRGLEEVFEVELARTQRSHLPFAIALLDIDNFKKLNDTKGHAAGDAALTHLVRVIKDMLRPTDTVARYGGEEFVILLPETSLKEAVSVLQRLQRELTKRFFMHNNEKLLITFSAGITLVDHKEPREAALSRADQAMYQAKRLGKNRVEVMLAEQ
ncbi:diguanylate cyclase [Formivibrio citricus]|uniref:diguanylate cyclase n=1 Tax=Formivibrio citricus TaxID=83765 RepID=A0A1I4WBJ2_9NEIS|nr:GGDEF domain-containing protein [Formivibrio citricus]SFN10596.1 diguanylate cyclase [Formivibrio citricus]